VHPINTINRRSLRGRLERRANVGVDEIIAFEKQGVVGRYRERVGEAIADVQPRPIAAPAEAAKRVDCDFRRVYKLGVSLPDAPLVRFRV
jgi:hypothetical protein